MSLLRLHHARLETETHTTKTAAFFPRVGWKAAVGLLSLHHVAHQLRAKSEADDEYLRSDAEEMSVTHSESFSNSSFCPSKRVALNKSLFLAASAFLFSISGVAVMLTS